MSPASFAMFLAGLHFLHPGLAAALQKTPAFKPDGLKAAALLFIVLFASLQDAFVAFVKLHGSTVCGARLGAEHACATYRAGLQPALCHVSKNHLKTALL